MAFELVQLLFVFLIKRSHNFHETKAPSVTERSVKPNITFDYLHKNNGLHNRCGYLETNEILMSFSCLCINQNYGPADEASKKIGHVIKEKVVLVAPDLLI
jgi:hypothetical protein